MIGKISQLKKKKKKRFLEWRKGEWDGDAPIGINLGSI
jgi:hypothetical protein